MEPGTALDYVVTIQWQMEQGTALDYAVTYQWQMKQGTALDHMVTYQWQMEQGTPLDYAVICDRITQRGSILPMSLKCPHKQYFSWCRDFNIMMSSVQLILIEIVYVIYIQFYNSYMLYQILGMKLMYSGKKNNSPITDQRVLVHKTINSSVPFWPPQIQRLLRQIIVHTVLVN